MQPLVMGQVFPSIFEWKTERDTTVIHIIGSLVRAPLDQTCPHMILSIVIKL